MSAHISSRFNQELENIRSQVLKMGGLVQAQWRATLQALREGDGARLEQIVSEDRIVNDMEVSIDQACQVMIVRRQPVVSDLRMVMTVTRVITDLERMGDEIKKIAMTGRQIISARASLPYYSEIDHIGKMADAMLTRALDAFARLEAEAVVELNDSDVLLDRAYDQQFRALVTYMMEDPRLIGAAINILFIQKSIERLGDHAKNIAEHVVYLARGIDVRHLGTDEIRQIGQGVVSFEESPPAA